MISWTKGECSECGDDMKVFDTSLNGFGTCKQCKLLMKFERIAYALEMQVGIE